MLSRSIPDRRKKRREKKGCRRCNYTGYIETDEVINIYNEIGKVVIKCTCIMENPNELSG